MSGFAIRNLKVFFKDRTAVFFSLLSVFIIIGLYALFLGDVWVKSFEGLTGVRYLMDSWIIAGLLAVTSITTTMGAFGTMVEDRVKKLSKDFSASPLRRSSIVGGYTLSSFIIGVIMSLVTLVLAEVYVVAYGGELISPAALVKVIGLILLSTFTNTSIVLFITSLFNSMNAFATASTIIGTVIGFLTGIYLPIGQLPAGVQWAIKLFPVSHAAALLRQELTAAPLAATFAGAPQAAVDDFTNFLGITYKIGDTILSPRASIGVLLVTAAVFYALSLFVISRKKER
jgi:multidrug/hemolysin transport system permease protein